MAFTFVPPFEEGNKQTNPETGVEYIYSDGAWRALGPKIEDEFDTLDNRYIKLTGTSTTTGTYTLKGDNQTSDGTSTFQRISGGEQKLYHIATPEDSNTDWVANVQYVKDYVDDKVENIDVGTDLDELDDRYLKLTGGTLTGTLQLQQNQIRFLKDDGTAQMKISPNSGDYWTNIWAFNSASNGGFRFRVAQGNDNSTYKTFLTATYNEHQVGNSTHPVETTLSWLKTPTANHHAANKQYVDDAVSSSGGGAGGILNLWTYRGAKNNGNGLNDGEFGSKKMANGVIELYLSNKNSRGTIYHPTPPNSTSEYNHQITNSSQNGSPMTVMHKDGRCLWYAETKKITFNSGTDKYCTVEAIKYRKAFDNLVEGEQYMLNVAGFISPISGW